MNIDWYATWVMLTGIGTVIMAIAIITTAAIAAKTLLTNKQDKRDELSFKLVDIWIKRNYDQKISYLKEFIDKRGDADDIFDKDERWDKICELIFKYRPYLESIENFLFKLENYLERGYLNIKNINVDFFDIFSGNIEIFYSTIRGCQDLMRRGQQEKVQTINRFFAKIAKYKKEYFIVEPYDENKNKKYFDYD